MRSLLTKSVGRMIAVCAIFVVVGIARLTVPVRSAPVTPTATDKVTIYDGVMVIMPCATGMPCANDALEFGNGGRDIASTREIFFRPSATSQGTNFSGERAHCSVDGAQCGSLADCSQSPQVQTCVTNAQNLLVTGDFAVARQLCFNGFNDCKGAWPVPNSQYWSFGSNTLTPSFTSSVRIGDSRGTCSVDNTVRCYADSNCPVPQTCTTGTDGIAGKEAFEILATTASPAMIVTKGATFGEAGFANRGQVNVSGGNLYVNNIFTIQSSRVWTYNSPTDTQDGSGISADMFDGDTVVPFSAGAKDIFWKQYFTDPDIGGATPLNLPSTSTAGIFPLLCVRSNYTSVCVNGPKAGASCGSDSDCPTVETCSGSVCQYSGVSCVTSADCPKTNNPQAVKCQQLYRYDQKQCAVENLWRCSNDPLLVCISNSDCGGSNTCQPSVGVYRCSVTTTQPCNVNTDCPSGEACTPGTVINVGASCTDSGCDTSCSALAKCNGSGSGASSGFGTQVRYNKGECIRSSGVPTTFCRCSVNMRSVTSLPYLDATSQPGGGDICSGNFSTGSFIHPPATS